MGSNCCSVCNSNATVSKDTEVDLPDQMNTTHTKIISDIPKEVLYEQRPCVLVRNVNTGIAIDIRWVIDEELLDAGMEQEE